MTYANDQASTLQDAPTPSTMLESILRELSNQNSRLLATICDLEKRGHKAHNTEAPQCESQNKMADPIGLLSQIGYQVQYLAMHITRLDEFNKKLSELI